MKYVYEDDLRRPEEKILNRLEKFCDYNKQALELAYANRIINRLQHIMTKGNDAKNPGSETIILSVCFFFLDVCELRIMLRFRNFIQGYMSLYALRNHKTY